MLIHLYSENEKKPSSCINMQVAFLTLASTLGLAWNIQSLSGTF